MLIALSRYLETKNTNITLLGYPVNIEGLLDSTSRQISNAGVSTSLDEVEEKLLAALPYNAGEARIYSLSGEIARKRGDQVTAAVLFNHALKLAPTEKLALLWSVQRAVIESDYDEALTRLDILFRRWPDEIVRLSPIIPALFNGPSAFETFLDKLKSSPPWRSQLLRQLSDEKSPNKEFTARLIAELAAGPTPPKPEDTQNILAELFKEKRYELAYQTFLFTLPESDRNLSGYVFDAAFIRASTNRTFDWQIRPQPGVKIIMPDAESGALIEFSNTPLVRVGLQQSLKLPAGKFRIEMSVSASHASMPKSLFWNLKCVNQNEDIANVEIPEGDYRDRILRVSFSISPTCPVQLLSLKTNALVASWNDRYAGKIVIKYTRISED